MRGTLPRKTRRRWGKYASDAPMMVIGDESTDDKYMRANTKADIKKCPAFVKKLGAVTVDKIASLTKDFRGLNLTKYIAEGPLRPSSSSKPLQRLFSSL